MIGELVFLIDGRKKLVELFLSFSQIVIPSDLSQNHPTYNLGDLDTGANQSEDLGKF